MKAAIKYAALLLTVFVLFFCILIFNSNFFYNLYTKLLYNGKEFYGEEGGNIMFDMIYYVFLPLSILFSSSFSFMIYYIRKRHKKTTNSNQ